MNSDPVVQTRSRPVINVLSKLEGVKGLLCFGSYAMGTFDPYSDFDLYAFCRPKIVPSLERQNALQKIDGVTEFEPDYVEFEWADQWCPRGDRFRLNGIQFDIIYNTIDWIRTIVRKVKEQGSISIPELKFRPYTMLGLLDNSVILYDPEAIVQKIKSSLYPYPTKLKKALLADSILIVKGSLEDLRDYCKRGIGNTAFYFHLGRIIDSLGTMLFAINERYDPATKRTEDIYRELEIVPERFLERYTKLLETPLTTDGRQAVVNELGLLIQEVEDLMNNQAEQWD